MSEFCTVVDAGGISQEYGVLTVQVAVAPTTFARTLDSSTYTVDKPVVREMEVASTLVRQMMLPPVGRGVFRVMVATTWMVPPTGVVAGSGATATSERTAPVSGS